MKKRKNNIFNQVKMSMVPSNTFDLCHDVKMSFGMGMLVPHVVQEVVPGDKWNIRTESLLRFAPLIAPVMHRVEVTQHFYFVPNRILWSGWEDWITGEAEEGPPYVNVDTGSLGKLWDYLGYQVSTSHPQSALPVAAYVKVYDEYYRDQNLIDEKFNALTAGNNDLNYLSILQGDPLRRAWEHDYFTSCLPFAQKGDAVQIPLTVADGQSVYLDAQASPGTGGHQGLKYWTGSAWADADATNPDATGTNYVIADAGPTPLSNSLHIGKQGSSPVPGLFDPRDTLKVDVQSDATDINSLRRAFRLQEWLEKNARGGTRYIENLLAHFGVRSSDARLQRPEYLGGTKSRMVISEVLSSAETDSDGGATTTPLGQMAGHGISADRGNGFKFYAEEHGWIIGIINVQPVTAYQQGIPRHLSRMDRLDYYWPTFANIGEQEVLNKELFVSDTATDDETFGYIPRYSEYKYAPSRVHGEFKDTLSYWHWGREFATTPTLNEEFIECNPRDDQFAVTATEDQQILAHIFVNAYAKRKMPRFGVPQI